MYQEILGLRAIRSYRDDPIAADDLSAILEAARWTGSSKNRQLWSFIVVRDPEQQARLASCGDFTDPIRAAPVTLALVQESGGSSFDIGRAAQNVMLAADAIGVASCPITLHRDGDAGAVLGLPSGARCRYAIALGYPGEDAGPARFGGRKPRNEVTFAEQHGKPL
jgi:nitroreductase